MGPLLKRVTFTGDDGAFDEMADGLHIKLFFKREHQTDLNLPYRQNGKIIWPESDKKPYACTYSVAGFCPHRNLLEVDFVMHEESGPASAFAYTTHLSTHYPSIIPINLSVTGTFLSDA